VQSFRLLHLGLFLGFFPLEFSLLAVLLVRLSKHRHEIQECGDNCSFWYTRININVWRVSEKRNGYIIAYAKHRQLMMMGTETLQQKVQVKRDNDRLGVSKA